MLPWTGPSKRWILSFGIPLTLWFLVSSGDSFPDLFPILQADEIGSGESQTSFPEESAEVPDPTEMTQRVWTLMSLQTLAQENNPTLQQAAASADMARGIHRQLGLYPNPQLGYLRNDSDNSAGARSKGVFIGQELVTTGKLKMLRLLRVGRLSNVTGITRLKLAECKTMWNCDFGIH